MLTIAIPFYTGKDYLRKAIESVRRQSSPSWELLVCDDASPETGVEDLVTGYASPLIRYYRNSANLGMAGNWNRCIELARTDLVNLLHADDELLPNYAAVMLRAAERHPQAAALFCNARIIDENSQPRFSFPDYVIKGWLAPARGRTIKLSGQRALAALSRGNFIMCPTVCYRKSRLQDRRFLPTWKFVLDLELFTRLLLEGETLVGLPDVAYAYRRHSANATTAYTASVLRFEEESRFHDQLARIAAARGWNQAARIARDKLVIKLNLMHCILSDLSRYQLRNAWRKLSFLEQLL